jgi:hypothetical protein
MIAAIYARTPTGEVLLLAWTTLTLAGCADDYSGSAACTESVVRPSTEDRHITDMGPVKAKGANGTISGHGREIEMVQNPNAVLGREAMPRNFTFTCFVTRDGAGWKVDRVDIKGVSDWK